MFNGVFGVFFGAVDMNFRRNSKLLEISILRTFFLLKNTFISKNILTIELYFCFTLYYMNSKKCFTLNMKFI